MRKHIKNPPWDNIKAQLEKMLSCHPWKVLLAITVSVISLSMLGNASNVSCPTWFYFNNNTQQCECGALKPWGIHCNQREMKVEVANGYCISYLSGQYFAGDCYYAHLGNFTDRMYSVMPQDPDRLNEVMCSMYKRKGLLCGQCIDGYGPAVYSLEGKCVDCSKFSVGSAVILYLFLEFFSILLFFILVMIFHINITDGPLLGYILFCQVYMLSVRTKETFLFSYLISHLPIPIKVLLYASLALCGVWSLKFSWMFIPPFCISSQLTGIHIQLLELVPPIITITILLIACVLIELHKRNCSLIVLAWKTFSDCLAKLRLNPVSGGAFIHTFATFIFLSAYNLNNVAIVTLIHDPVSHGDGSFYKQLLGCDPTITWMSNKHLTYLSFMGAAFMFLVLIPSFLLCLYPTKFYCRFSQVISPRKQLAIKTFAESLHHCFTDGLNGTRDYRALAGVSLMFGSMTSLVLYYSWNFTKIGYSFQFSTGIVFILASILFSYWGPCRSQLSNISINYHGMVFGFLSFVLSFWENTMSMPTELLQYSFILAPIVSHILVLTWAGTLATKKIMSYFKVSSDFV